MFCTQFLLTFRWMLSTLIGSIVTLTIFGPAFSQLDPGRGPPGCVPVSERQIQRGCYVLVSAQLGELPRTPLFWHIDSYPNRAAAEAAKGARGDVVEALGKVWLMSIAEAGYRPSGGTHVGEVGPLVTNAGTNYTAAYMEAIMLPGATAGVHHHPGPEAIFTFAGEECMETPAGKLLGRPGVSSIIVPAEVPHTLLITGSVERMSLALILHDSSQPFVIRTHNHGWTPKGLCKN